MQRSDTEVTHELLSEPFLQKHFPSKFAKIETVRSDLKNSVAAPRYEQAIKQLLDGPTKTGAKIRFSKEISYFVDFDEFKESRLADHRHVFLVREPAAVMQSLYRVAQTGYTTYFDPSEAGFAELFDIYKLVSESCSSSDILVLDSDKDLMIDPERCLRRFCQFADLPYQNGMLTWEAKSVSEWQFFKGWHDDAERSTGFAKPQHEQIEFPDVVGEIAALNRPIYSAFSWLADAQRLSCQNTTLFCVREAPSPRANLVVSTNDDSDDIDLLRIAAQIDESISIWLQAGRYQGGPDHEIYDHPVFTLGTDRNLDNQIVRVGENAGRCVLRQFVLASQCAASGHSERHVTRLGKTWLNASSEYAELASLVGRSIIGDLKRVDAEAFTSALASNASRLRSVECTPDFVEALRAAVADNPDRVALSDGQSDLTMRQLLSRAMSLAKTISASSKNDNSYVVVRMDRSVHTLVTMTSCLISGIPFVEMPSWYTAEQEKAIAALLNASVAVCDNPDRLPHFDGPRVNVNGDWTDSSTSITELQSPTPTPGSPAYGILTSGTTGPAKVVEIPYRALLDSFELWRDRIQPGDRLGLNAWLPGYAYYPMLSGATTVVIPDNIIVDPAGLHAFIEQSKLNQIMITPTVGEVLLDTGYTKLLKRVWLSGEKVSASLWSKIKKQCASTEFIDLYGSNEVGDVAIRTAETKLSPVDSVQVSIVGPSGRLRPTGTVGEIAVGGVGLFSGYKGTPLAETMFIRNPINTPDQTVPQKLFRTGDFARQLADGSLEFVSRRSAHIKIRGFKVVPERVAAILEQHPNIERAFVDVEGAGATQHLAAWVQPEANNAIPTAGELVDFAREYLPYYAVPGQYFLLGAIEAGPSQKLSRQSVVAQRSPLPAATLPLSETEALIAEIWRKALGRDSASFRPDNNLIEIGGSLVIAKVTRDLEKTFGAKLDFGVIYSNPTLSSMASLIENLATGDLVKEEPLDMNREAKENRVRFDGEYIREKREFRQKKVLVTGSGGFLGRYIANELAARQEVSQIINFVRAERHAEHSDSPKNCTLHGDITKPYLGLDPALYDNLRSELDCIVHAAAEVNWLKPYDLLKGSNVNGTASVIDLACRAGARLVFVSTLAEEVPSTGYNVSKLVAERIVEYAHDDHGLEYIIARCGDITSAQAPSLLGATNSADYVVTIVGACLELGLWPSAEHWSLDLMPVDRTAAILCDLALRHERDWQNATFELRNPNGPLPWGQLRNLVRSVGISTPLREVDIATFRGELERRGDSGFALQARLLLDLAISDFEADKTPVKPYWRSEAVDGELSVQWCRSFIDGITSSPKFIRKPEVHCARF